MPIATGQGAVCGEIGQYIVVARRAGDNFYIGAGTNGEARTLPLSLDFPLILA